MMLVAAVALALAFVRTAINWHASMDYASKLDRLGYFEGLKYERYRKMVKEHEDKLALAIGPEHREDLQISIAFWSRRMQKHDDEIIKLKSLSAKWKSHAWRPWGPKPRILGSVSTE